MWPQGRKHVVIGRSKHTTHSPSCAVFEASETQFKSTQFTPWELGVSKSLNIASNCITLHDFGCYDRLIEYIYIYVCALVHMPAYPILHFIQSNITLAVLSSKTRRHVCGLGVGVGRPAQIEKCTRCTRRRTLETQG